MSTVTSGSTTRVVLAVLLVGSVAFGPTAVSASVPETDGDALAPFGSVIGDRADLDPLADDATNDSDSAAGSTGVIASNATTTANEATDTTRNASGSVAITSDTAEHSSSEQTGTVTNTTETVDNATGTVDKTTETVENTTDETVDNTTETVENTTDETVDNTTETVENTTDEVVENTTETVENTTDEVVDNTTDEVVDNTTETIANTTDEVVENTTETIENTTDEVVDNTTETVENTTDEVVDTITDTSENTTNEGLENTTEMGDIVDETSDLVENTTEVLGNVTGADPDGDTIGSASGDTAGGGADVDSQTDPDAGGTATDGEPTRTDEADAGSSDESGGEGPSPDETPTATADTNGSVAAVQPTRGSDGGSGLPAGPTALAGIVVAGAAGAVALSGIETIQTPGVVRAGALQVRASATGVRAWLADARDRLWRIAALLRYSRWDDSDPLEHDDRGAVFDAIEETPGIYLTALDERTDGSLSTLRHHLRILEGENLITTEKVRGKRRYFPVRRGGADPALVAALDDPATEGVLTTLADAGPMRGGELAEALDRDPSTVSHHLSRLEDDGLVTREREGRAVLNGLSDAAAVALSDDALASGEDRPAPADD